MSKDSQNNFVPSSYEELYNHYIVGKNSLAAQLVRHFVPFAEESDREDLIQDVFTRCMEKDVISDFDPTKANFGGVVYFVCRTICCNWLDRRSRNPITGLNGGTIVESADEFEPGQYSLESLFGTIEPLVSESKMDARKVVAQLREFVGAAFAAPVNKRDQSLQPMLEMLYNGATVKEIAAELGVTSSTVHNWMEVLKGVALDAVA